LKALEMQTPHPQPLSLRERVAKGRVRGSLDSMYPFVRTLV